MKTNSLLFCLLLLTTSLFFTGCQKQNYEITIFYASDNITDKMLYLVGDREVIDSAVVTKKPFKLKGYTDSILVGSIVEKNPEASFTATDIIIEKDQKINVILGRDITFDDNGGLNSIWADFNKAYAGIMHKNKEAFQQRVMKNADADELKQLNDKNSRELEAFWKASVIKNIDNPAGAAIFKEYCTDMLNPADFEPLYQQLKYAYLFPSIEKDREHYKQVFKSAEGQPFIDFKGKSMEGKDIRFSDFAGKGKYVLAYFWSTNSISCRGNNPEIVKLNQQLGGEKFMVVGINEKNSEEKFREAVKKDGIDYTQLYMPYEGDNVEALYDIDDVPYLILFDPEGKIVKRGIEIADMQSTIKAYLNK